MFEMCQRVGVGVGDSPVLNLYAPRPSSQPGYDASPPIGSSRAAHSMVFGKPDY